MAFVNNTMIIRRELLVQVASWLKEGTLSENIDKIPYKVVPKNSKTRRCCIHKERAIVRYKMFPILGLNPHDEEDEMEPISSFLDKACKREEPSSDILTVVDEACSACVKINYVVTNLCKGCVASPCYMNCPKRAISFDANGQAQINHERCINCGICKNACPYHSIVYVPVPCEEACPVGAISKDDEGVEHIDDSKCIYCGKCVSACPFGSVFEVSQIIDIFRAKEKGQKIVAIPAPSIVGQYKVEPGRVFNAIKQLGFDHVVEVAEGATQTTKNEAHELQEKLEEGQSFMTTSCCPSYVQAMRKHVPEMLPYVSTTGSPMYYTALIAKERYPDAKIVFIGPCIAKRKEAQENPNVDYVMTFEELDSLFEGFGISVKECDANTLDDIVFESRNYGQSGGVAGAVLAEGLKVDVNAFHVNGIDKKMIKAFKTYPKGKNPGNFIEVMACEGGCIAGPSTSIDSAKGKRQMIKTLGDLYK